jgi:hypothetical protein
VLAPAFGRGQPASQREVRRIYRLARSHLGTVWLLMSACSEAARPEPRALA